MHATLRVDLCAICFPESTSGKDHVSELGGLGHKEVAHYEEVQRLECVLTMCPIRVGHDRVLAIDDHGADLLPGLLERTHLGDTRLEVDFTSPRGGEFRLHRGVGDRLEARVAVRDRSDIAGTLDVVLPTHGVNAGAFPADVASHQRDVAQALDVIDTADVLGDTEGIVDRTSIGLPVEHRGLFDHRRVEARDRRRPLRCKLLHVLQKRFGLCRSLRDEPLVDEPLALDDVGHAQEKRGVGPHTQR